MKLQFLWNILFEENEMWFYFYFSNLQSSDSQFTLWLIGQQPIIIETFRISEQSVIVSLIDLRHEAESNISFANSVIGLRRRRLRTSDDKRLRT